MELVTTRQAQRLEGPITLDELTEHVRAVAEHCCDHQVFLGQTRLEENNRWRFNGEAGRLTGHAFRQLCGRLSLPGGGSVPGGYLARCPAPLAAENVNYWSSRPEHEGARLLVRTRRDESHDDPTVRAILSGRYAAADHLPLLEMLRTMVPGHNLAVQAWSLDDDLLTIRLLLNEEHPASLADPLRIGLAVSNSEIGLGRVSINGLVTRLVCSNGLIVKVGDLGGVQRRHIGRAGEDLYAVVYEGLTRVLEEADEAAWRLIRLQHEAAPHPVEAFVRRTAEDAEVPAALIPAVITALEGDSLYDVVNALTRVAQRLPVAERLSVESAMSRFLRNGRNGN